MKKKQSVERSRLTNPTFTNENKFIFLFFVFAFAYILLKALFTNIIPGIIETGYEDLFFVSLTDYFMDFFNPVYFSSFENPYVFKDLGAIYPPICYLLYRMVLLFVPAEEITDRFEIRENRTLIMLFAIITLFLIISIIYMIVSNLRFSSKKNWIICFCIIFSFPMLFLIERGNILLLCLSLCLFFVFYHNDKRALISEISLIALAVAAAIKIYPAVFGLLLFFEKKPDPKKIARCILYGVLAFILPFFALNGIESFNIFIGNLSSGIEATKLSNYSVITRIDISTFFYIVHSLIGKNSAPYEGSYAQTASTIFTVLFIIANLGLIVLSDKKWKKTIAMVNLTILLPSFVYTYVCVFYIIPLLLAFNDKSINSSFDKLYVTLMIIIMVPVPIIPNNVLTLLIVFVISLMITLDTVKNCIYKIKHKNYTTTDFVKNQK